MTIGCLGETSRDTWELQCQLLQTLAPYNPSARWCIAPPHCSCKISNVPRTEQYAGVAELADAQDLKSCDPKGSCGFETRPRHLESSTYGDQAAGRRPAAPPTLAKV